MCFFGWPESGGATSVGCDVQNPAGGPFGAPAAVTSRGTEIFEIDADEVPADAWPKYVKVTVARAKMNKNGTYGTTFTSVFHYNRWPFVPSLLATKPSFWLNLTRSQGLDSLQFHSYGSGKQPNFPNYQRSSNQIAAQGFRSSPQGWTGGADTKTAWTCLS